jgi:predicted GH43/DUF377 family glycosyl hydrolase
MPVRPYCFAASKIDGACPIWAARSHNGVDGWQIDSEPTLMPSPREYPEEIWGIEDPRITFVPELQQYVVTYTSYSRGGPGVSLALTKDFRSFERYGVIVPPDDKDSALLPRRIDRFWALIHRPMTPLGSHMWISYSPDLRYLGRNRLMLEARRGAWWGANKIGLSPPPIETSRGWLVFYHGVRHTPSGCLYRLGLGLFDLENPAKCLLRGDSWIFGPEADYERHGDVDDVVFPCGYTMDPDGDGLDVYYGAAECSIALARASVRSLLEWLDAMEVASADERRTYETTALDFAVGVWVSPQSDQSRVHYQETDLPGLLPMWKGIRLFLGIDASSTVEFCRQPLGAMNAWNGPRSRDESMGSRRETFSSSQVSNLAQTRKPAPVIIYSPECVGRATTANS